MSMDTITEFLEKNQDKKYTVKELSKELGINVNSVRSSCNRLKHFNDVLYTQSDNVNKFSKQVYKYQYKLHNN